MTFDSKFTEKICEVLAKFILYAYYMYFVLKKIFNDYSIMKIENDLLKDR